jgi:hypothetical protein
MVLEVIPSPVAGESIILVIDMVIFSEQAIQPQMPVTIPWSDWRPQYTCCFPHHPSHQISVFGSKMAYALPQYRTPGPGQRVERLSGQDRFYVHIWDFNKRAIARAKNANDRSFLIRRPGPVADSCSVEKIFSDRHYTTAVCRTAFEMLGFERLFLESDRLTLTWVSFLIMDVAML